MQKSIDMLICLADVFGVTMDYLLGRKATARLDVDGLPLSAVAHLALLIANLRIAPGTQKPGQF